jgi:hypothetical protein
MTIVFHGAKIALLFVCRDSLWRRRPTMDVDEGRGLPESRECDAHLQRRLHDYLYQTAVVNS